MVAPDDTGVRQLVSTVVPLGIAQIISWGSLYYSLAVLALPIRQEWGLSEVIIFGAFTAGLLVSGVAAPLVGRQIDREGGRLVMSVGSVLGAIALVAVALADAPLQFVLAWMLAGVAMAACLYDPAFASLYQMAPHHYRRAVTGLTLLGGFASTVFWPLTNALASAWGWRMTVLGFAALNLFICAPLHYMVLPGRPARTQHRVVRPAAAAKEYLADRRFFWLAAAFAAISLVFSALSSFMILALGARGFSVAEAVWVAALIGPMQVLARIVEWSIAGRASAVAVGLAAVCMFLAGMLLLNVMPYSIVWGVLFAVCYGGANGILTITRGTVPVELFGAQQQGALLGSLARPSFVTKALAPVTFAAALNIGISMDIGLALLAVVAACALGCFLAACRQK